MFIEIYQATVSDDIDQIELEKLENTASEERLLAYYKSSLFDARCDMHADISDYIIGRRAEK